MAATADTQQPDQQQVGPGAPAQYDGVPVDETATKDRVEVCLLLAIEKAAKASELVTGQDFGAQAGGCKEFAQAALFLAQAYAQLNAKPTTPGMNAPPPFGSQAHAQQLFAQTASAGIGSGIAPAQSARGGNDQSTG